MQVLRSLGLGIALSATRMALACSCFGPQTFCGVLNPPFPNPEWWIPESVVLGVKLADFQHGMDVKVIQSFSGSLLADDTVRVWGDCGLLCRHYPTTWAVGDTVIWGLMITDLAGNSLCGTSFEQPTDHMISICGVYYLDYANGTVSGPITTETFETMPIEQFADLVIDCLSTGIATASGHADLVIRTADDGIWSSCTAAGVREWALVDATGRVRSSRAWDGSPLRSPDLPSGAYVVQVRIHDRWLRRKVIAP